MNSPLLTTDGASQLGFLLKSEDPSHRDQGLELLAALTAEDLSRVGRALDLSNADLSELPLRGMVLTGASMRGSRMQGLDLRDADLRNVDFRWADLMFADLRGACLEGADLRNANCIGARLDTRPEGAHLRPRLLPGLGLRWYQSGKLHYAAIEAQRTMLGRLSGPHRIRIKNPRVSRRHCIIEHFGPNEIWVEDVMSCSGTYLNGVHILRVRIHAGDVLTIGGVNVEVIPL